MVLPLFVYGTLRDPELIVAVLGRMLRAGEVYPVRAPGLRAVHYPDRIYPALVRSPGVAAEGLLLTGLTPFERDLLDAFEGEEYHREPIAVMLDEELHEAYAYMPTVPVPASAHDWSLSRWQEEHKPKVLVSEAAAASDLRARLIAIRPN